MRTYLLLASLSAVALVGCNSSQPPAPAVQGSGPAYNIRADVRQLMVHVIEPASDVVWDSVGTIITAEGREEIQPITDEQWTTVRNSAAILAESGNLMMLPGRARNQDDWMAKCKALTDRAYEAIAAADAKDPEALFTAGSDIYLACAECHEKYALELPQRPAG